MALKFCKTCAAVCVVPLYSRTCPIYPPKYPYPHNDPILPALEPPCPPVTVKIQSATIVNEVGSDAEILICTGDRDAFQLVSDHVTVLYPKKGVSEMARMTPSAVVEKYGLTPEQYPDFAALRGDPSDNLPSIPGVGEKTAAKWIIEYGSLENLIAKIDEVGGKVGDSLRANINSVLRNHELTHLVSNVPIDFSLDELAWQEFDTEALREIFSKLELLS